MTTRVLEGGFFAVTLPSGVQVLGKSYGQPATYANRYQANRALEGLQRTNPDLSGHVCVTRPFYVVIQEQAQ
jgi:hypothetical protein